MEHSEKFQSFRLKWDNILEQRKQEKIARKDMMKRQLETYIGFQVCDVLILYLHWVCIYTFKTFYYGVIVI